MAQIEPTPTTTSTPLEDAAHRADQDAVDTIAASPEQTPGEATATILELAVRIVAGGLWLGIDALASLAPGWIGQAKQTTDQSSSPLIAMRNAAVGTTIETGQAMVKGVRRAWNFNKRLWQASAPLRRPLDTLGITDLARKQTDVAKERLVPALDQMEKLGRTEVERSQEAALRTVIGVIDLVLAYLAQAPAVEALIRDQVDKLLPGLADDPAIANLVQVQVAKILPQLADDLAIQELVRVQAGQYLDYLAAHPEQVQKLIRQEGDNYIDYLNDQPEAVQTLIQGQSLGLAGQVMDEVRERTVTADSIAEMIARGLLRKRPRSELPAPPNAVQNRAEAARVPSDYIAKRSRRDGK